ncbi:hypothetical protein [Nocardia sp. CDC160]|uniref:hypothetical protein n=1 Tax=Nocardia sp. CDC160 TaxID=3112166 RepID=UPI002DB6BA38|nr:hypothetical protein [Nocardia sp. CDC160]MEC3915045.1 hypothetical protein [Nocardia sp. CDC160]
MALGARLLLWDLPLLAGLAGSKHRSRLDWYEHGIVVTSRRRVRAFRFDGTRVWRKISRVTEGGVMNPVSLTYRVGDDDEELMIPVGSAGREQWGPVREMTVRDGIVSVHAVKGGKSVLLQAYPSELIENLDLFWALAQRLRVD